MLASVEESSFEQDVVENTNTAAKIAVNKILKYFFIVLYDKLPATFLVIIKMEQEFRFIYLEIQSKTNTMLLPTEIETDVLL